VKFFSYSSDDKQHFAPAAAAFEHYQPWPAELSFEWVETSYFGFNIPAEGITCEIYHWMHPYFRVCSGGVLIFRGFIPVQMAMDYIDWRTYMPMPEDLVNCTMPSGVHIEMLAPGGPFRLHYEDQERETKFNIVTTAIMPLAVRPDTRHFTQAMRTKGELSLRGCRYEVDGFFTRDRSWGAPRSEKPLPLPPMSWMVGVFDEGFAFHVSAFDSPIYHPDWAGVYPDLGEGRNLLWGYIWDSGRMTAIEFADVLVLRTQDGLAPREFKVNLRDTDGRKYAISGRASAQAPFQIWDNMGAYYTQVRWECNDKVGHGDHQECDFNDYFWRMRKAKQANGPAIVDRHAAD
jgi:hypothetical protein